ncbi:hypothetical protein NDU88_001431 [Pleurodeles waltl]|uniref:Uncharacterized protein n=1 Tax=Pleurodeles waltl TaxID=8319 RepID=A0AAV7UA63_PLEWA|nr:hypothetical protein NDU88_001431 [Pleurodeles waltl]
MSSRLSLPKSRYYGYHCRYSPEGEFAPLLFAPGAAPARPGATRQPPLPSSLLLSPKRSVHIRVPAAAIRFGSRVLPHPTASPWEPEPP